MSDEIKVSDINFKDLISFYDDKIDDITFVISKYKKSCMFYSTILLDKKYADVINFFDTNLENRHFLDNKKLPVIIKSILGYDDLFIELTFECPNFKRIKLESINVINEILREKMMVASGNEKIHI